MNYELYREIWEVKFEDDPDKHQDQNVDGTILPGIVSTNDIGFDSPYAAFRTDLSKHKMVWTGHFRKDLWFYIKNEHALLSICLSEKHHPLGRWERFFIEIFVFALGSMWAASVVRYFVTVETGQKYVDLVAYYGYSMAGGVVKMVVNVILKAVATCSCLQEEGTRMRKKWERCGYICMAFWAIISMGFLALAGYFVHLNGSDYWKEWLLSLSISYAFGYTFSLVLAVVMFTLMFDCCKRNDHKFKFVITYKDYLRWKAEDGSDGNRTPYAEVSQDEVDVVEVVDVYDM